jgi:release factor glutamine methyltransferase
MEGKEWLRHQGPLPRHSPIANSPQKHPRSFNCVYLLEKLLFGKRKRTMLPTPDTSHVDYDQVYEPAEDSYLLLDTLSSPSETAFLHSHFRSGHAPLVVEIGTGSGVVLAFLAANSSTIFNRHVCTLGTDLNRRACIAASKTVRKACEDRATPFLTVVNTDLTSALKDAEVDVLVFNPPYVPAELPDLSLHAKYNTVDTMSSSEAFDRDSHLLALSYAGGVDGMEVTERLLDELPRVLSRRGVAYVLFCAQNKPEEIKSRIRQWPGGWEAETVGSSGKKAGWEKLCIVRIMRKAAN